MRTSEIVTIAGKFCESGDILIRDIELPRLAAGRSAGDPDGRRVHPGDGQQLQLARRPAVVLVRDGQARLIQRRETYADLVARDLPLSPDAWR